jgi:hypothetical protein
MIEVETKRIVNRNMIYSDQKKREKNNAVFGNCENIIHGCIRKYLISKYEKNVAGLNSEVGQLVDTFA